MSGPPTDIPASQLWLALSSQERPSKVVDFPRKTDSGEPVGQLRIRVLTQEEQMSSTKAAETLVKEHLKDGKKDELGYERLFTDAVCVEVLFRACRDVDDIKRTVFPSPKHMRNTLTTEECAMLFQHYLTVQLELGPIVVNMSDDEVEAWISRLAEGGSAFPFDLLSSDLQKILLLHMAYQLRSSQTDKSSVGSPPEESSPNDLLLDE
jgi:hypothetical protein